MISRTTSLLFILFIVLSISSCKNKDYEIVLPIKNSEFIGVLPAQFLIRYSTEPSKIVLNGLRVEQFFEYNDGVATASGELLQGYLVQGENQIAVEPGKLGPRRYFYFDNEGPRIVVREVTNDKPPIVRGELVDPSGAYFLSINGNDAELDRYGNFAVSVDTAPFYTIETEDRYAQQSTYTYAHRATVIPDIIKLNADQSAIDDLIPYAQELVEEQDLAALLGTAGANTLFNESANIRLPKVVIIPEICVPVVGCTPEVAIGPISFNLLSVKGSLTTLSFDELEIDQLDLNSGPGWEGLSMDAQIRGVDLGVEINTDVLGLSNTVKDLLDALNLDGKLDFLAGDFNANISVNRLRLAADIGLNAVEGDVNLSVIDIAAVGLGDLDSDFAVDFSVPQAIRDFGFGLLGKVVDIIEAGISGARDLIVDLLLGKLVPLIVNLVLDPLVNELQVRLGASINNGAFLTVFVGVETIDVVANNTLKMTLNGRVGTETVGDDSVDIGLDLGFPDILNLDDHLLPDLLGIPDGLGPAPGLVPTMLGSRYSSVALPDPDRFRAPQDELGISVSSNLINQALLAIYEAGILSPAIPIRDDRGNSGAYFITDIESANERILFLPKVAPELTFRGQQISVAYLTLDHFEIQFQDLVNDTGDDLQWQTYATYELNSELAVKLSSDSETGLELGLISPEFDIFYEIYDNRRKRFSFPTSGLLFSSLEPLIIEQINGALMQFLLPESLTLTQDDAALEITPRSIETVGVPREHFGISAVLDSHTDINE